MTRESGGNYLFITPRSLVNRLCFKFEGGKPLQI